MRAHEPDPAYVTLATVPGIGRARMAALLNAFGESGNALSASFAELASVRGMTRAAATAVKGTSIRHGARLIAETEALGGALLTPFDADFPDSLRLIPDAPILLFASGRVELLQTDCVAMVGSRHHSRYGAEACRNLAAAVVTAGLTVVSGMARGLDAIAHSAALDAGGCSVGVLGNGLGVIYPAANRALYERMTETGCLLTEYPPGERPNAGSFPRRNRLISGLSRATVVVEAKHGSGALITADCALAQGREVMAVPGPITSPVSLGTNKLLQLGAKPVVEARDILEEYDIDDVPRVAVGGDLTPQERSALEQLAEGQLHVDELCGRLTLPPSETLAVLTGLEIRGLVKQETGKMFGLAFPLSWNPPAAATPNV